MSLSTALSGKLQTLPRYTTPSTDTVSGIAAISRDLGSEHPQLIERALISGALTCAWIGDMPVMTAEQIEDARKRIATCRAVPEQSFGGPRGYRSSLGRVAQ